MTRLARKSASLAIALAFQAGAFSEALQLRECPHHDAVPASTVEPDGHEAPHAAHSADREGSHGTDAGGHDGHHGCTCVGVCELGGSASGQFQPLDAETTSSVDSLVEQAGSRQVGERGRGPIWRAGPNRLP